MSANITFFSKTSDKNQVRKGNYLGTQLTCNPQTRATPVYEPKPRLGQYSCVTFGQAAEETAEMTERE